MADYNGIYKLVSSENFDAFLQAMGINALMRKAAAAGTPTISVTVTGDHWKLVQSTKLRSNDMEFDLGVARQVKTMDGKTATSVVTKEGDTLVEKRSGEGRHLEVRRQFDGPQLRVTMTSGSVSAVRVFQKQ